MSMISKGKIESVGFRCAPSSFDDEANLTSLARIVHPYIRKYRPDARKELGSFRDAKSLREAVAHAGMAMNFDAEPHRFPHQWRIRNTALLKGTDELTGAITRIRACKNFRELINIVDSIADTVGGIGELYVYDTALRIGAHLRIFPKEVYLHRGTRDGARALGRNVDRSSIPVHQFPREFRQLEPHEIEDVLCIYKKRFSRAASR